MLHIMHLLPEFSNTKRLFARGSSKTATPIRLSHQGWLDGRQALPYRLTQKILLRCFCVPFDFMRSGTIFAHFLCKSIIIVPLSLLGTVKETFQVPSTQGKQRCKASSLLTFSGIRDQELTSNEDMISKL